MSKSYNTVIGIRKNRIGYGIFFGLFPFFAAVVCIIMWARYDVNYEIEHLQKYGVETEATCIGITYNSGTGGIGTSNDSYYNSVYQYISAEGKSYLTFKHADSEEEAISRIGEKMTVVIDTYGTAIWNCDLNYLRARTLNYTRDYILAIIFCFPVAFAMYLLIYRGIYRSVLNYKIRKKLGVESEDDPNDETIDRTKRPKEVQILHPEYIAEGEVVKTCGLFIKYVKVKFVDERRETKTKWAGDWFSMRAAKYLQQKKFINIVPYKTTYGILEEMPPRTRKKKEKKNDAEFF
ncbi:MAG: hypothetical protein K2O41_05435 [Clostridia bacterium]|nr:hypothetical protein [Clostridia bacterium]